MGGGGGVGGWVGFLGGGCGVGGCFWGGFFLGGGGWVLGGLVFVYFWSGVFWVCIGGLVFFLPGVLVGVWSFCFAFSYVGDLRGVGVRCLGGGFFLFLLSVSVLYRWVPCVFSFVVAGPLPVVFVGGFCFLLVLLCAVFFLVALWVWGLGSVVGVRFLRGLLVGWFSVWVGGGGVGALWGSFVCIVFFLCVSRREFVGGLGLLFGGGFVFVVSLWGDYCGGGVFGFGFFVVCLGLGVLW